MCLFLQKSPIKIPKADPVTQPEAQPDPIPEPIPEPEPIQVHVQSQELEPEPVVAAPIQEEVRPPSYVAQQQPDVIPTHRESVPPELVETLPPPAAFSSNSMSQENGSADVAIDKAEEQIYSNLNYEEQQYANLPNQAIVANEESAVTTAAIVGNEDCDLSEIIEDTKIKAIALYDYQASAEDEISFDPNDVITHIEQVRTKYRRFFYFFLKSILNVFKFVLSFSSDR